MSEYDELVREYKRKLVRDALSKCTNKQQLRFKRIFPAGIEKLGPEKLKVAYNLCQRTINANSQPKKEAL